MKSNSELVHKIEIIPVGYIKKQNKSVCIVIYPEYQDGLSRINQSSHIIALFWFHQNDTPEKRRNLKVHPRGNRKNPLTGVFATRSPTRPNPIGLAMCKILSIEGNAIYIDRIDAFDRSPVIDIKPYIPRIDAISHVITPEWMEE